MKYKLHARNLMSLSDGDYRADKCLYFRVSDSGRYRRWILNYTSPITKKRTKMGLGGYPDISLSSAREIALKARVLISEGRDPRRERETAVAKITPTFKEATLAYVEAKKGHWKNKRTYLNHLSRLERYAHPYIGDLLVNEITREDILRVLKPVWETKKATTCSKLQEYIKSILDYSTFREWRTGDNPALWKGNLDNALPSPAKLNPSKGHYALPAEDLPKLFKELSKQGGNAALVAKFCILTATRSGEARGARWSEIDLENKLWAIPAERMKTQHEHIVVLSNPAVLILDKIKRTRSTSDIIFLSQSGGVISDMGALKPIKKAGASIGHPNATLHGLRATFSTWAANDTAYDAEAIEHALSHVVGSSVKRAYQRKTMEEKRRPLMEEWAKVCTGSE